MTYTIHSLYPEKRNLQMSYPFLKLSNFFRTILESWVNRQFDDLSLKLEGLVSIYKEEENYWTPRDFDETEEIILLIQKYDQLLQPKYFVIKQKLGLLTKLIEELKSLAIDVSEKDTTDYLNFNPSNKKHLEKSLKSKSVDMTGEFA